MLLPKKGKKLPTPFNGNMANVDYGATIAAALRRDLGRSEHAIKTVMAWSSASERTVKNWLSGAVGPSGVHLASLARRSDAVFEVFLLMAGRDRVLASPRLAGFRAAIENLLPYLEEPPLQSHPGIDTGAPPGIELKPSPEQKPRPPD